jgi:hypothetical protein
MSPTSAASLLKASKKSMIVLNEADNKTSLTARQSGKGCIAL